jgi:hypothetical protein
MKTTIALASIRKGPTNRSIVTATVLPDVVRPYPWVSPVGA